MNIEKSLDIIKGKLLMIDKMLKQDQEEGHGSSYEMQKEDFEAIEILLTAYEKEKEKREIAEENHKVLSLDLGKALKELGLYEDTIIADELALEINKRFVSKDKIKPIQIIDLDGKIHNVYKIEEE